MTTVFKKPFIFGLSRSIHESPFLTTEQLYKRVGHNTGNLAFHHAIDTHLGGHLPVADWDYSPDKVDTHGDVAVIPCANQIGAHIDYGKLALRFAALKSPIVGIGLGVQSDEYGVMPEIPKGSLAWLRALVDHAPGKAPNITVRGEFTREVLAHHGFAEHLEVLGCPTLFINPDPLLGKRIAGNLRDPALIAVVAGDPSWPHLATIEASLTRMVTATAGAYIGQAPIDMLKFTRGEGASLPDDTVRFYRDYACPEMNIEEFRRWGRAHGRVFFDIPTWIEHYRRFDFVVGTRIHGTMLALQAGVPALCIAHDSRTIELCQTMLVPYVEAKHVVQGFRRDDLRRYFQFDADAFDKNRQALCRKYINFLHANKLPVTPWLEKIAAAGEAAAPVQEITRRAAG